MPVRICRPHTVRKDDKLQKYLTLDEVRRRLGNRARSAIYDDIAAGRLPKPLKFGRRVFWPEDELENHIRNLAEGQRAGSDTAANCKACKHD